MGETPSIEPEIPQSVTSLPVEKPPTGTLVVIGGILTLIAGVSSVYNGVVGLIAGSSFGIGRYIDTTKFTFCGVFLVAFGIVAITGGFYAIKGRHVILAIIGACLGMAGGGLAGFWLGLIAMAMFFLSNADLTD